MRELDGFEVRVNSQPSSQEVRFCREISKCLKDAVRGGSEKVV